MAELEKMPLETRPVSVNRPESGTYGEKAELDRLGAGLSAATPQAPASGRSQRPGPGGGAAGGRTAPLPPAILSGGPSPTLGPAGVETSPMPPSPQDSAMQRMQILDSLANDPGVSDVTREWASMWLDLLTGRTGG